MTPTDLVELVKALAWPTVALVAVIILRAQLPSLLGRAKKIGAFGFELEFQAATEFSPTWSTPDLGDVRHATAAMEFSSHAMSLMAELGGDGTYDYAVVNLGEGRSWLTSRLYIFSIMLQRMRGLRCWVFLRPDEGARRVYLGLASPNEVRWALARTFPWLETAYAHAYGAQDPYEITSAQGALEPFPATQLVQTFLANIQSVTPPPAGEEAEWIQLSENGPWERARWLNTNNVASVLGSALRSSSIPGDLRVLSAKEQTALLRVRGDFVALLGDCWTFNGLVDRRAALEKLGEGLSNAGGNAP